MRSSLRRRILTVLVLAAVACGASLVAIFYLARMSHAQRAERAHEVIVREAERLRDAAESGDLVRVLHARRVPSGYVDPLGHERPPGGFIGPVVRTARAAAVALARPDGPVIEREQNLRDGPGTVIVAVAALDNGAYAWASVRLNDPRVWAPWRLGVFALALATLGLVVLSVSTLYTLERGVGSLQHALNALAKDLTTDVPRPGVRELDVVADGIASLATALTRAHTEHAALTRALAERERLAALGRVAAGVAHEVRNPLAAIKLRVDLARRALAATDSAAEDLGEVSSEIARLDRLVADLLVVAGRRTGPRVVTDLGALATERVSLLAPWAAERGVSVAVQGCAHALVDPDAMARVMDNLVRNAVEAVEGMREPSGVRVQVSTDGAMALLRVVDPGPGVPKGREAELFEPFFTTRAAGTGLGLALSRAVAESHLGTLTYQREGGTTCFVLRVPAVGSPSS